MIHREPSVKLRVRGVMVVNLNFGHSVKTTLHLVAKGKTITAISPIGGQLEDMPKNGWWILPGHGRLFLLKS